MKKAMFIILYLLYLYVLCDKVYAINNITIDNENLIPKFEKNIKVYNYYTNKDIVRIKVDNDIKDYVLNDSKNEYIVENYKINIFKNYNKDNKEEVYLTNLTIDGYDIKFDRNTHEYSISINDEERLNIDYELSNDEGYISITGNGNFNKSDNLITINVDNKEEYKIHVLKSLNVSYVDSESEKEFPVIKKEIVKFIVITISCIVVFLFYYLMFNKKSFYI